MLHNDIDAVISQTMLLNGELLQAHIVLEHLTEVDGYRLANGFEHRVVDVKLLKCVVAGIKNREDSNDAIMVDLVVGKVQRQ